MYNRLTSFVIPLWWSIISGITGRFHRNVHWYNHKRENEIKFGVIWLKNEHEKLLSLVY